MILNAPRGRCRLLPVYLDKLALEDIDTSGLRGLSRLIHRGLQLRPFRACPRPLPTRSLGESVFDRLSKLRHAGSRLSTLSVTLLSAVALYVALPTLRRGQGFCVRSFGAIDMAGCSGQATKVSLRIPVLSFHRETWIRAAEVYFRDLIPSEMATLHVNLVSLPKPCQDLVNGTFSTSLQVFRAPPDPLTWIDNMGSGAGVSRVL